MNHNEKKYKNSYSLIQEVNLLNILLHNVLHNNNNLFCFIRILFICNNSVFIIKYIFFNKLICRKNDLKKI